MADVLEARTHEVPALIYVHPADTVRDAVQTMRHHGVSQLPVAKGEMPIAAAEVMGAVSELSLMHHMFRDPSALDRPVEDVMSPPLPTVGIGQPVAVGGRPARDGVGGAGAGRRPTDGGAQPVRRARASSHRRSPDERS